MFDLPDRCSWANATMRAGTVDDVILELEPGAERAQIYP